MNEDNSAEIAKFQKDIEGKNTEIKNLQAKIAELNSKLSKMAELEGTLKNLNAKIELKEKKIADLEKQISSKTTELKQSAGKVQESQKEIEGLNQKFAETDSDLVKLKASYEDVSKLSDELTKQISDLNKGIEMKNKVIENLNTTITPLEANLKEKESQLKRKSTEVQDLTNKFAETDKKLKDKVDKLEKSMMKLEELDRTLDDKNKEISQLREWNDAKAHELMEKDSTIQNKTKRISDLSNQITGLTQKLNSINANFTEQVTKMKEKQTNLFDFIQRYQTTVSDAIKGIQELTLQKVQSHNEFLVTMLQDLHKQELNSFLKQADLLDQKIATFQGEKFDFTAPTIDLPPIIEEERPELPATPAPSVKPAGPFPPTPSIKPAAPIPRASSSHSVRSIALTEAPTFEKKVEAQEIPEEPHVEEMVYLHFEEKAFVRVNRLPETGINLVLDEKNQKWIMSWSADVGFVQQRTAERQARSIANTGFTVGRGARLGKGFALELIGQNAMPDRLLHDQHEY